MEGIIMADYPNNVVDGQELPASTVNQILAARVGDIKPIDATTRNYTDQAGELGTSTYTFEKGNIADLTIVTDTIGTTTTNGAIALAPDGTGRVENDRVLGEWEFDTTNTLYPTNTIFQAPSDIFVIIRFLGGDYGQINVTTGSTAPPANTLVTAGFDNSQTDLGTVSFPIRKGDYWTFYPTTHGFSSYNVNVIQIGA